MPHTVILRVLRESFCSISPASEGRLACQVKSGTVAEGAKIITIIIIITAIKANDFHRIGDRYGGKGAAAPKCPCA